MLTSSTKKCCEMPKNIEYKITPEEMWDITKGTNKNWGIEGYEIPRQYFDVRQQKWLKKREQIINAHKREWPPLDWPKPKEGEKPQPPVRINFIDEQVKWANSFNDPKKSEEIKQSLESRGTFKPLEKKPPRDLRSKFLDDEKKEKERVAALPKLAPWKEAGIEQAKTRIQEAKSKEKDQWVKDKERYTKEKPQWPRCERVTVLADAEYCGEQVPFWNTSKKEEENGKDKKLFFPNKFYTMNKSPVWSFNNKNPVKLPTEQMQSRDQLIKDKVDNLKGKRNLDDKNLIIDVQASFDKVTRRGRNYMIMRKPFDYASTDQYKLNKQEHPDFSPGPQHYWKMKSDDKNERPANVVEEKDVNGKQMKVYYMNHKRTDYRQYKPMRSSVF